MREWPQRKCFLGQVGLPCKPQGRHGRASEVSTIALPVAKGPNPNSGTVAQNTVVVGQPTAEAMCVRALSTVKTR